MMPNSLSLRRVIVILYALLSVVSLASCYGPAYMTSCREPLPFGPNVSELSPPQHIPNE